MRSFNSFKEIADTLRKNGDLNEEAYRKLKKFIYTFIYYIPIGIISLIVAEHFYRETNIKSPKAILFYLILLYIHIKIKRESLHITKLYSFGDITDGTINEIKNISYRIEAWGIKCNFYSKRNLMEYNLNTVLYDGYDSLEIYEFGTKNHYSFLNRRTMADKSLIGKKIIVIYLPNDLQEKRYFSRSLTLKPCGYTILCKEQLKRYCLSKKQQSNFKQLMIE